MPFFAPMYRTSGMYTCGEKHVWCSTGEALSDEAIALQVRIMGHGNTLILTDMGTALTEEPNFIPFTYICQVRD